MNPTIDIPAFAACRAKQTQSPVIDTTDATDHRATETSEQEWIRALMNARESLRVAELSDQALFELARACRSPSTLTCVVRLIYQEYRSYPAAYPAAYPVAHPSGRFSYARLVEYVLDSPFAFPEWMDAIEYFEQWLKKNQKKVDLISMLDYLHCCTVSPEARAPGQILSHLLSDMLELYGFIGS
jgi:hypothetical protein